MTKDSRLRMPFAVFLLVTVFVLLGYVVLHRFASKADRSAVDAAAVRNLADFHRGFFSEVPPDLMQDYNERLKAFSKSEDKEWVSEYAERYFRGSEELTND